MTPIEYIPILKDYYRSQGFGEYPIYEPEGQPWITLKKPLRECRLALICSAGISSRDREWPPDVRRSVAEYISLGHATRGSRCFDAVQIERVGTVAPSAPPDPQQLARQLEAAGAFVETTARLFVERSLAAREDTTNRFREPL